ncbi:hypothetical protein BE17_05985 [Sorangium cellulosum]|uniref:Uncharacterized protein n=1 Tax=Sorangium cellulosum TaxID=56 RepID=A0A150QU90_SORCE|nr:hypothetical protein BE17_05985 [Sorangium cellulosum]
MKVQSQRGWTRRGFSLLWEPRVLTGVTAPTAVVSMRGFFALRKAWPDDLPGSEGNALVVAGLDGCLDSLSEQDAVTWLETDLKSAVLSFQEHYEGQAALILWLASGRTRIGMDLADEEYFWKIGAGRDGARLPLGRCLWGGAEADVARILVSDERAPDFDGDAYVGLHHPRIS